MRTPSGSVPTLEEMIAAGQKNQQRIMLCRQTIKRASRVFWSSGTLRANDFISQ